MSELAVGMLVQSSLKDMPLRSGAEWYPAAVVVQLDPFVLVSEKGDMVWTHAEAFNFEPCGVASVRSKLAVNDRLQRDGGDIPLLPVSNVERATLWFETHGEKTLEASTYYSEGQMISSRVTVEEMYQMFKTRMESERGPF